MGKNSRKAIECIIAYISFNVITYIFLNFYALANKEIGRTLIVTFKPYLAIALYFCFLGCFTVYILKSLILPQKDIVVTLISWLQPIIMILTPLIYFHTSIKLLYPIVMNIELIMLIGYLLIGINVATIFIRRKHKP